MTQPLLKLGTLVYYHSSEWIVEPNLQQSRCHLLVLQTLARRTTKREWGTWNLPICQFAMHVSWLNPWILDSNLPTCNLNGATPPCRHRSSCTAWGLALARRPSTMASPVVRGHCLWEGEPVCGLLLVFMGSEMSDIILDAAPGRKGRKSVRTTCPMLLAFVERLGPGHSVGHSGYACVLSLECRKPFFLADLGAGVCKSARTHLGPSKILNWNQMRRRDQKDIKQYQTMSTKNSSTEWCVDWMENTFSAHQDAYPQLFSSVTITVIMLPIFL